MALQGTLDTFSLPDVLRLLATTGKSGCLHIDGDRGRGSVWLEDGAVVGATSDRALNVSPIDEIIFELLRFGRGSFSFAADEVAPENGEQPKDVESTLRKATQLLDEWRDLERVVPSLSHRVAMAPELTVDQVTIDASRWEALVAIGGGRSVGELGELLRLGELSVSRAVSDLVELGVAVIESPGTGRAASSSSSSSRRSSTSTSSPETGGRGLGEAPARRSSKSESSSGLRDSRDSKIAASSSSSLSADDNNRGSWMRSPDSPTASASAATTKDNNGQVETAPKSRTRQSPSRPSRARRTGPTPATVAPARPAPSVRNGNSNGNGTTRGNGNGNGNGNGLGHAAGPVAPPAPPLSPPEPMLPPSLERPQLDRPTMPPPTMPTQALPDPGPGGYLLPPSLDTGRHLLPPSLDTGRLGPSPLPMDTGQIPAVASSALPPDLSWAADDNEPTQAVSPLAPTAMPNSSVFRPAATGRLSTPPPPPAPAPAPPPAPAPSRVSTNGRDGDTAPHVAALSPEARNAVEATIGRSGGGPGGMPLAGATPDQLQSRTHLLHFLSSVRP